MQKNAHNTRRNFLKKVSVAAISIGALSMFKLKKPKEDIDYKVNTLSKEEADAIIRNEQFKVRDKMKPAPPPAPREGE